MPVTGICAICGSEKESVAHALFRCPHAYQLWSAMREVWHLPGDSEVQFHSPTWFRSLILSIPESMLDALLLVSWRAWYARNEITHDKLLPTIEASRRFLCRYVSTLRGVKEASVDEVIKGKQPLVLTGASIEYPRHPGAPPDKKWDAPPLGLVKLNIDGSFKLEDGTAGTGMVLRDHKGDIIFSACRQLIRCDDALEAELEACKEGLQLALEWSQLQILVETDCAELVAAVKSNELDRSRLAYLISDIKNLAVHERIMSFVKVDRIQNRVSHLLANLARLEQRTFVWLGSGPETSVQASIHERPVTLSV
jgi:ribonuclease HI